ncbi:cytochrome P450 78A3, partial [Metarhizium majus ARSEF 297]
MRFSGYEITGFSLLGCAVLVFAQGLRSRLVLAGAFVGFWLGGAALYCAWAVLIYPHYLSPLRRLPTVKGGHWLFGHGQRFATGVDEPTREWINTIPHEGLLRYFWWFNDERVIVSSNKGLAEVLVTKSYQFKRPDIVRRLLSPVLGYGILLTEGDVHKVQRRNLMPAFAFRHIKDLYPVFWRKAREVVQAMSAKANSDGIATLDALDWANRCTLDIIGLAGMGVDFGSIQDPTNPLATTYKSLTGTQGQAGLLGILLILLPAWLANRIPLRRNNVIHDANRTIRNVCKDLIRDKKRRMANRERTDVDILSVALESGLFSDENLVDQLMTFLAAGHDTTASALTWATYVLSCYPDVQTRLRDEVRERLPRLDADADITSVDIDKMPYLNAVCNEVLRFFSPVPRTSREAVEDTTVQGYPIPKGSVILLSPWATNVDQNLWGGDALEFKPERWLANDAMDTKSASSGGASSVYAFLTFLHGPRSCIGASFAKSEFACLLAAWVGRFEFDLVNDEMRDKEKLVVRYGVTARPKGGLPVRARVLPGF